MYKSKRLFSIAVLVLCMFALIIDSKTALEGAVEGIKLCLYTVIPSLLPFFVLSIMLNSCIVGRKVPVISALCRPLGIPQGGESLLLLGLLGGYPVGAQGVFQAYRAGGLKKKDAERMLGFCNNAGPAFIFGMAAALFQENWVGWLLWLIQIISALIVGIMLGNCSDSVCTVPKGPKVSLPEAMERALRTMASVCGWVLLFRVIIHVLRRWFLWLMPAKGQIVFIGLLELSNGCVELAADLSESFRFVACSCMLSFGGLCVAMQTVTVCKELCVKYYFLGKLLQLAVSLLLAWTVQAIAFSTPIKLSIVPVILVVIISFGVLLFVKRKNSSGNSIMHGV